MKHLQRKLKNSLNSLSSSLSLSLSLSPWPPQGLRPASCVCVPITKLFAWGEGDRRAHVLWESTRQGLCGLVCPSRTSERGEEGDCVKEGGGEEGEREMERALGLLMPLLWQPRVRLCSSATGRMPRAWNGTSPIGCVAMAFQWPWSAPRSPGWPVG